MAIELIRSTSGVSEVPGAAEANHQIVVVNYGALQADGDPVKNAIDTTNSQTNGSRKNESAHVQQRLVSSTAAGAMSQASSSVSVIGSESTPGIVLPKIGFVPFSQIALILLVIQTVGAILFLRVSRTIAAEDPPYLNTSAVFVSEVIKLIASVILVYRECEWNLKRCIKQLRNEIIRQPLDTFKVGIPALLYTLQNNLLYIALTNMSGALYQVTYQMKIMTTAGLSVVLLRRRLSVDKWISLVGLTMGVALIQVPSGKSSASSLGGNVVIGTLAVLLACFTSGFAGVYFEKILKGSKTSVWIRNIQLASLGTVISLLGAYWTDWHAIRKNGLFQGYNWATYASILFQSAGGLIVAAVLKYADNILKCFGNAIAIVCSCMLSYYLLGDYDPTFFFVLGTTAVIASSYAYGTDYPIIAKSRQTAFIIAK